MLFMSASTWLILYVSLGLSRKEMTKIFSGMQEPNNEIWKSNFEGFILTPRKSILRGRVCEASCDRHD
jgi:hypothetical protein